jgi:hypothetical protein
MCERIKAIVSGGRESRGLSKGCWREVSMLESLSLECTIWTLASIVIPLRRPGLGALLPDGVLMI